MQSDGLNWTEVAPPQPCYLAPIPYLRAPFVFASNGVPASEKTSPGTRGIAFSPKLASPGVISSPSDWDDKNLHSPLAHSRALRMPDRLRFVLRRLCYLRD